MTNTDFLNAREAAERYRISSSHLAKLRLKGTGPRYLKIGSRVIYKTSDFEDWLAAHGKISTSEYSS